MNIKESFIKYLENSLEELKTHKLISIECNVNQTLVNLHDTLIRHCETLKSLVENSELSINYIKQFQNDLNETLTHFPIRLKKNLSFITEENKFHYKSTIESHESSIIIQIVMIIFNLEFFSKLGFFNNNIVAVGANGSGKTSLSNKLKTYLNNNGVVISAQKILIIPTFSGISNINTTSQNLIKYQKADKSSRLTYSTANNANSYSVLSGLGNEFQILLDNLLAERNVERNRFFDSIQDGNNHIIKPITKLDKAFYIWNSLIEHRTIECADNINITLKTNDSNIYPAHQMSDGEKVMLFLIAQVLQAPQDGFIIVDEPEMYLHKTILRKLWDTLEKERKDCIFIYLTHDLDFATNRTDAKKIWVKSFKFPDYWEIENLPENEMPEQLLLELLGSRKPILFCEGKKGSIDEKIYSYLFPKYTITPVENCTSVINYTKAYNKIPGIVTKAFGIIDSDHHEKDRLIVLKSENVYSFSVSESENLLLDESFLKILASQILIEEDKIESIKDEIIASLETDKELQVSNYVSAKINYYYKESHVSKGNTLNSINENLKKFNTQIKIEEWYEERLKLINNIILEKNYIELLSVYNNKGIKHIVNKHFNISDFTERALKLVQFQDKTHQHLLKYFPKELTE